MIKVSSNGGRIGPLWWFNSVTTPYETVFLEIPMRVVRWGTFGFGPDVKFSLDRIE